MAYLKTLREFHSWLSALRDRLPLACLLCRSRARGGLCTHCRQAVGASMDIGGGRCGRCDLLLPPGRCSDGSDCPDCRHLSPALERVTAAFDYAWPGDLLIQRLKPQGRFSCAPVLASLLAARCRALRARPMAPPFWCEHRTLVTAVPAGPRSLVLRGYNPAGEVGRALARRLKLEWRPGLVLRHRDGRDQKGLGRNARRLEVRGLYHCSGGVAGREVLIVDDVMTTGSTLSVIADALKEQGAAKVWGAVVARTPARL